MYASIVVIVVSYLRYSGMARVKSVTRRDAYDSEMMSNDL